MSPALPPDAEPTSDGDDNDSTHWSSPTRTETQADFMTQPPDVLLPSSPDRPPLALGAAQPASQDSARSPARPRGAPLDRILAERPVLPPRAFRAVLTRGDEELAAIIEGTDARVHSFLADRESRQAAGEGKEEGGENATPNDNDARTPTGSAAKSLFQRHSSAEKIEWSRETEVPIGPAGEQETPKTPPKAAAAPAKKKQNKWTPRELSDLAEGMVRFGRNWRLIQRSYPLLLQRRSARQLMLKAKHIRQSGKVNTRDK